MTHLHLYPGPDDGQPEGPPAVVSMRLVDLLPLIAQAHHNNYAWLDDFLEDEVVVTEDLFEILRSFKALRPSA